MNLGNSLFNARKKSGLSQEEVAEKLGVSRQTVSKWEQNETVPDIYQSKKLAVIYRMSLDKLIEFDFELNEIQEIIDKTSDETTKKINWTKAWSKKYPILSTYQQQMDTEYYGKKIKELLNHLKNTYNYDDLNALLVLKDIMAHVWNKK